MCKHNVIKIRYYHDLRNAKEIYALCPECGEWVTLKGQLDE